MMNIDRLREKFQLAVKEKNSPISYDRHFLYFQYMGYKDIPDKEEQTKCLLQNIESYERFIDYEISPLCLTDGDADSKKIYFLKGKFNNEEQFYIYTLRFWRCDNK